MIACPVTKQFNKINEIREKSLTVALFDVCYNLLIQMFKKKAHLESTMHQQPLYLQNIGQKQLTPSEIDQCLQLLRTQLPHCHLPNVLALLFEKIVIFHPQKPHLTDIFRSIAKSASQNILQSISHKNKSPKLSNEISQGQRKNDQPKHFIYVDQKDEANWSTQMEKQMIERYLRHGKIGAARSQLRKKYPHLSPAFTHVFIRGKLERPLRKTLHRLQEFLICEAIPQLGLNDSLTKAILRSSQGLSLRKELFVLGTKQNPSRQELGEACERVKHFLEHEVDEKAYSYKKKSPSRKGAHCNAFEGDSEEEISLDQWE